MSLKEDDSFISNLIAASVQPGRSRSPHRRLDQGHSARALKHPVVNLSTLNPNPTMSAECSRNNIQSG